MMAPSTAVSATTWAPLSFKSNDPIRNRAQAVQRYARCAARPGAVSQHTGAADAANGALAPPAEHFIDAWDAACKGRRTSSCLPKTGKRERADKLIWCTHEAILRQDQDILRRAGVIALARDARKGNLLATFIAVAGVDPAPASSAKPGTTAEDITQVALDMIHISCQLVGDPPRKRQRRAMGPIAAGLELEAHILQHIEAITADSA